MGLRLQGIPEEDQGVDRAFGDTGPDLLVAAKRAAQEQVDRTLEPLLQDPARGARGVDPVASQQVTVVSGPVGELHFHVVVGHERDLPLLATPGG